MKFLLQVINKNYSRLFCIPLQAQRSSLELHELVFYEEKVFFPFKLKYQMQPIKKVLLKVGLQLEEVNVIIFNFAAYFICDCRHTLSWMSKKVQREKIFPNSLKGQAIVSFNNERCIFWWEILHLMLASAHYLING